MKRNENKTNRNRSLVVLLVLCAMFASVVAGCNKPVAENPVPSTPTSEVESEVVSEEVSEPVSEEPSEEIMDLTPYTTENGKKVVDLVNDMEYDEFKVIVWTSNHGAKAILSDGDSYTLEDEDDFMCLYYPNQMQSVQSNMEYTIIQSEYDYLCLFDVYRTGESIEVAFTGTDIDGKEYEITFYITKDW